NARPSAPSPLRGNRESSQPLSSSQATHSQPCDQRRVQGVLVGRERSPLCRQIRRSPMCRQICPGKYDEVDRRTH
ncbi:hypothetical protein PMAYCL1PPCAC_12995, partial [Pristionchus mayeri]